MWGDYRPRGGLLNIVIMVSGHPHSIRKSVVDFINFHCNLQERCRIVFITNYEGDEWTIKIVSVIYIYRYAMLIYTFGSLANGSWRMVNGTYWKYNCSDALLGRENQLEMMINWIYPIYCCKEK